MIELTRLNQQEVVVNASHIVTVESTPDTKLTLLNGEKLMVLESPDVVTSRIITFLRRVGWVPMLVRPQPTTEDRG